MSSSRRHREHAQRAPSVNAVDQCLCPMPLPFAVVGAQCKRSLRPCARCRYLSPLQALHRPRLRPGDLLPQVIAISLGLSDTHHGSGQRIHCHYPVRVIPDY